MLAASVWVSSPPLTRMRPSARSDVPGQNMLCATLVIVVTVILAGWLGANCTVTVWSSAPVPAKCVPVHDAQSRTPPLGRTAPETGTTPLVSMTPLQRPLASDCGTAATGSSVHRNFAALEHGFCTRDVVLLPSTQSPLVEISCTGMLRV